MFQRARRASCAAPHPTAQEVSEALRRGEATDAAFDRFLPAALRAVSRHWWTPLAVARQAAAWLDEQGARFVLDIGSGSGKFCVAAALSGRVRCIGLEHRTRLVTAARDLARRFEVDGRVAFIHGSLGETVLPTVDAYYLYNPFGENLFGDTYRLDRDVELGAARFMRDVAVTERLLHAAPVGTCLVTYNGFGGRVPSAFARLRTDRRTGVPLCLWRKVRDRLRSADEVEDRVDEGERMRGAPGYEQRRPDRVEEAAIDAGGAVVEPARDGAGAHRHQEAGIGHRVPGQAHRILHRARERAGQDQGVGVAG